jgi:hypothetical protein
MPLTILNGHVLIPFPWQWDQEEPCKCVYKFGDTAAVGPTGDEDRFARRAQPRKEYTFRLAARDAVNAQEIEEALRAAQVATEAALPLWSRQYGITAVAGDVLTLATAAWPWVAPAQVFVADHRTELGAAAAVTSWVGNALTLSAAPPAGDIVLPILFGRIDRVEEQYDSPDVRMWEVTFSAPLAPPSWGNTAWLAEPNGTATYILLYADPGDATLAATLAALQTLLANTYYAGDAGNTAIFVRIFTAADNQWLKRMGTPVNDELTPRYLTLAFASTANPDYYTAPASPNANYAADALAYQNEYARRTVCLGKLYGIGTNANFLAHLAAAFGATGAYADFGPKLTSLGLSYQTGINSATITAATLLADIQALLATLPA